MFIIIFLYSMADSEFAKGDINDTVFNLLLIDINEMDPFQRAGYYSVIIEFVMYVEKNNLIAGGKKTKNKKIKTKRRKNKKTKTIGGLYSNYPQQEGFSAAQNAEMALDQMEREERKQPGAYWGVYNRPSEHAATITALRTQLMASINGSPAQRLIIRRISNLHALLKEAQENALALKRFRQRSSYTGFTALVGGFLLAYSKSVERQHEDKESFGYFRDSVIDWTTWAVLLVPDLMLTAGLSGIRNWGTHWVEGRRTGYNHLVMVGTLSALWTGGTAIGEKLFFTEITAANVREKIIEFEETLQRAEANVERAATRSAVVAERIQNRSDERVNAGLVLGAAAGATYLGAPQALAGWAMKNTPESLVDPLTQIAATNVVDRLPLTQAQKAYTTPQLQQELKAKHTAVVRALNSAVPPKMQQQLNGITSWERDYMNRYGASLETFQREGGNMEDSEARTRYIDEHLHQIPPQGFPPQGFGQEVPSAQDRLANARQVAAAQNAQLSTQRHAMNRDPIDSKRTAFDRLAQHESWQWICYACRTANNYNMLYCNHCGASFLDCNSIYVQGMSGPGSGRTLRL